MVFLNIRAGKGMAALCVSKPFPVLADVQSLGRIQSRNGFTYGCSRRSSGHLSSCSGFMYEYSHCSSGHLSSWLKL